LKTDQDHFFCHFIFHRECLSVFRFVCIHSCLPIIPFVSICFYVLMLVLVFLSVYPSACLSVCTSVCPFLSVLFCLSFYLFVLLSVCPSICLSFFLFVLSFRLFLYLSFFCLSLCPFCLPCRRSVWGWFRRERQRELKRWRPASPLDCSSSSGKPEKRKRKVIFQ